jgi:hypothetical protein
MREDPTLKWRDGKRHTIGPLTLRNSTSGGEPHWEAELSTTGGTTFLLDRLDAEAIALAIEPSADLWSAHDSDRHGERRGKGWARLRVTGDKSRLRAPTKWGGKVFQIARIIMDAGHGETVQHPGGGRSPDYRRENLEKVPGPARERTRERFLKCCADLARQRLLERAEGRFRGADGLDDYIAIEKLNMEKETD